MLLKSTSLDHLQMVELLVTTAVLRLVFPQGIKAGIPEALYLPNQNSLVFSTVQTGLAKLKLRLLVLVATEVLIRYWVTSKP